jgi:hypothetical protein
MSYRNDRDADQARISALETELAVARRRIEELEGKRAPTPTSVRAQVREGATPYLLEIDHTFDGEVTPEQLDALVQSIRDITNDAGRVELLRSSLTWTSPQTNRSVRVVAREGRTALTVTENLGQLTRSLYGGIIGGVGGGGIIVPMAIGRALDHTLALMPFLLLGWLSSAVVFAFVLVQRATKRHTAELVQLFEMVAAELEATLRAKAA